MFFLEKGKAAVIGKDGLVHCVLRRGQYFGEGALLSAKISSTVRALTYCDVFELSREDFQEICDSNLPHESQATLNTAMCRSLKQKGIMNTNIMRNFRDRPKCCTRVSRDFYPLTSSNQVESTEDSKVAFGALCSPDSTFRAFWSIVIVLAIAFNLWMIPFRIAFPSGHMKSVWYDWVPDIFLVLDMYLSCYIYAFYEDGAGLIFDSSRVKENYFRSRFKHDVISTLPYELIYALASNREANMTIVALLKIARIGWIVRLPKNLNNIFRYLEDRDFHLSSLKLVEFLSGVILIAHVACCGFIIIAKSNSNNTDCDVLNLAFEGCKWKDTWIERQIQSIKLPSDGGDPLQQYLRSLNWAIPTLVVGTSLCDELKILLVSSLHLIIFIFF